MTSPAETKPTIDSPDVPCPECKGLTRHQGEGLHWCAADGCLGFTITPAGARALHETLCRMSGMTADQIVASWNKENPQDQW